MRPSYLTGLIIALFQTAHVAAATGSTPGQLIAGQSKLTPLIWNLPKTQTEKRNANPLAGLLDPQLGRRAESCPSGYGQCTKYPTRCCPLGGSCCSSSRCCDKGYFCYASGCCSRSDFGCADNTCCPSGSKCCSGGGCCSSGNYCVTTASGDSGCCPTGEICSGSPSDQCTDSNYSPCPNDDFCCPTGDTCYRDSNDAPSCSKGGASSAARSSTSKSSVSASATFSSSASAVVPSSATTTAVLTTSAAASVSSAPSVTRVTLTYLPTPMASPAANTQNKTISAQDSSITYQGDSWVDGVSSCNASEASKKSSVQGASFSYSFTGSAVFLNIAQDTSAGLFSVSLDSNSAVDVDGYASIVQCGYAWTAFGLTDGSHTLTVSTLGASLKAVAGSASSFELNNIVITQDSTSGSATSVAGAGATTAASDATVGKVFAPVLLALAAFFALIMI